MFHKIKYNTEDRRPSVFFSEIRQKNLEKRNEKRARKRKEKKNTLLNEDPWGPKRRKKGGSTTKIVRKKISLQTKAKKK